MPAQPVPAAVRLRDAGQFGLNRGNLRRSGWQRLSQGLHVRRTSVRSTHAAVAHLVQVLPRESGFGHLTAAGLRGWWLPLGLAPHVAFGTTSSLVHVQRRGLYVRRSRFAEIEDVDGLPVMSAAQILVELARDLSLVDLVPIVDRALAGGADPAALRAAARPGLRGARTLRKALDLADPKSESWWESVLRLQHTLTGLGPVESQSEIWDGGRFVARADLHLVGTSRYPECDGGEHRTPQRQAKDLSRDRRVADLGLDRYGYTTAEIARTPEVVIRDAETARGLPHDARRVLRWRALARASSLTAHGRTLLAARLERYRLAAEHPVASSGRPPRLSGGQNSPLDAA